VLDKEDAPARKGIFMIDASAGFIKEGPKNRLRAQDIHRIVDAFAKRRDIAGYARMASHEEIARNDFNLNLPRYIDSQKVEDRQDIEGHLKGGIPLRDVDALQPYWDVCASLRDALFAPNRPGYVNLAVAKAEIKPAIFGHPEFAGFISGMAAHFEAWRQAAAQGLKALEPGFHPKALIVELAEGLLAHYGAKPLIDAYDVYQRLMDYWDEAMQDDCYLIAADGWKAETTRVIETRKGAKGKPDREVDKGWVCDLVPKPLVVARYFAKEAAEIAALETEQERRAAEKAALEEEHGHGDGLFSELIEDGEIIVTAANAKARLKEIKGDRTAAD
jgi:type I restriction enzyme M protein